MVEILSARPPTPPRTTSRIEINEHPESPLPVQTPKESTFILESGGTGASSRSSKKVNFSPWPKYIKPPTFASAMVSAPDTKIIPSSTDSKPTKSILKATQSPIPVWSPNVDPFTTESLAMLLESVIQQLAGESMSSRFDAYLQFFGALRTYDGLPSGQGIAEKLNLITEFIQRDVSRDLTNGVPHEINLVNQALKLSAAFVWHPQISTQLSEEFKTFLVDHSITSLYEAKAPKSVLTHYMSILATQNFGPKVMTSARVTRLLTVMQEITKNISGNAIVSHRLNIYQRLLSQAKSAFISQANLWVEHLIFGLLHHLKDTRSKAITLGFQVATEAGPNSILSKNIRDLFDRPLDHDRKLVTEVRERMTRMMPTIDSGVHVPQIWSIIILLLRSKRYNLEQWGHFKEWVLVLQKCFNCSEAAIKAQAIVGWNRFVFAVSPNELTSRSLLKMLGKPVLSQFDRKKTDKSGSAPTPLSLTSYHNLLYYTFRPSASYQYLDIIWEEYVLNPSLGIFSSIPLLSDCLSRILTNLLWSPQAKIWTENRINETAKIEAEELPSVDSKWVRSRITSILNVFEHLFKSSVWADETIGNSHVALAWSNLSNALSFASSKEITPSGESMQSIASVWGLLHRLWTSGPSSLNTEDTDVFFERFGFLSMTMINSLGGIPFTEKAFLRNADEPLNTAVQAQRNTAPESPLLHLLRILSCTTGTILPNQAYTRLVLSNIETACNNKNSRGSRLELLQQCAELNSTKASAIPRLPQLSEMIWSATAQAAANTLQSFPIESSRERDGSVSRDYENVVKILSSGFASTSAFQEWSHLLESFVRVVRTEKGNQTITTVIVEPMSKRLMQLPAHDTYLHLTSLLDHSLSVPFLQGTNRETDHDVTHSVGHAAFPHQLIELTVKTLHNAYENFGSPKTDSLADFIEALTSFLGAGIPQFQCQVLQNLQLPLGLWLKDESYKINVDRGVDSRILTACRALSSATLNVLQTSVVHDLSASIQFEQILCSALQSTHMSIAKRYLELWSSTFALQPFVAPETILQAVHSAEARVQSAKLALHDGDRDTEKSSHSLTQDALGQTLHPTIQDTQLSSPVIRAESSVDSGSTEQVNEPQLPSTFQQPTDAQNVASLSLYHKRRDRRDIFSMIDSIQSSSPASTPRKSSFNTPSHPRKNDESLGEIPLTPTLASTEHEEVFIGSSPTPGTRDPTLTMNSAVLTSSHAPVESRTDPPSSPPEIHSQIPSPKKKSVSRSARRRAAKARKAIASHVGKQSTVNSLATSRLATEDIEITMKDPHDRNNADVDADATPRADETTPTRRLRSALAKDTTATKPSPVPQLDADKTPVPQPTSKSKSLSSSKKKRKQGQSKPADDEAQQPMLICPDVLPDNLMDSSEETETQIASQLGLDLELAVDMGDRDHINPAKSVEKPSSKKRKRAEEEVLSSARLDRRRSTRLSTAKDAVNTEPLQPDDSHLPTAKSQPMSPAQSLSPTATRRSTRSSQRKEDDKVLVESISRTQPSDAGLAQDSDTPRPSKRSRKSVRIGDKIGPNALASTPPSVLRDTRTRKNRSQQHAFDPESQISNNPSQIQCDTAHRPLHTDSVILPENVVTESRAVQNISLLSTEEATPRPASELEQMTEPTHRSDIGMDLGPNSSQQHGGVDEHMPSVATTGIQIQETLAKPKLDFSERGVAQSLKALLDEMKLTTLGPDSFREVDDLLFNLRCEAQNASARHNTSA